MFVTVPESSITAEYTADQLAEHLHDCVKSLSPSSATRKIVEFAASVIITQDREIDALKKSKHE